MITFPLCRGDFVQIGNRRHLIVAVPTSPGVGRYLMRDLDAPDAPVHEMGEAELMSGYINKKIRLTRRPRRANAHPNQIAELVSKSSKTNTTSYSGEERQRAYVDVIAAVPKEEHNAERLAPVIEAVANLLTDERPPCLLQVMKWAQAEERSRRVGPRKLRPGEKMPREVAAIVREKGTEITARYREQTGRTSITAPLQWVHCQVVDAIHTRNMSRAPEKRLPLPSLDWVRREGARNSDPTDPMTPATGAPAAPSNQDFRRDLYTSIIGPIPLAERTAQMLDWAIGEVARGIGDTAPPTREEVLSWVPKRQPVEPVSPRVLKQFETLPVEVLAIIGDNYARPWLNGHPLPTAWIHANVIEEIHRRNATRSPEERLPLPSRSSVGREITLLSRGRSLWRWTARRE